MNEISGLNGVRAFFKQEPAGGIILIVATVLALLVANSPLTDFYHYVLNDVVFRVGLTDSAAKTIGFEKTILHWVNDGMMAIFFFLVGLEIKREAMEGALSTKAKAILPLVAAAGGMAVPALLYYMMDHGDPAAMRGWAIPAATDIAFALGILALLGTRAPLSLKVLLTAIAVIDDLGAIIIIALFYGHGVSVEPLMVAGLAMVGLFILNRRKVTELPLYVLLGFIMWAAVLESGVHATLAGVVTALFIPLRDPKRPDYSPLRYLEHELHPWVVFGVLPLFAFANAGVSLQGMGLDLLLHPVTMGIALGLFVGKQIGIFGVIFAMVKMKWAPMPDGANWRQVYGVALLCGIGFTMSLFIGGLAFPGTDMQAHVRVGVLGGSILSAAAGYAVLRWFSGAKA